MRSLVVSTIVYFVAAFFIKRRFEDMGLPKGMTRSLMVFCLALVAAYGAAAGVDWLAAHA
jgi:cytochrome c oxidase assembly factor CtaG